MGRMILEAGASRLRGGGDRHRGGADHRRPARAARPTRATPPTPSTRASPTRLGLPRLPEPVALPARAAPGAERQPVPQAAQARSTCTTSACASGRTSPASCAPPPGRSASRCRRAGTPPDDDPPARCSRGCCPTSACSDRATRGVPRRPRRALRDLPRLGAGQEAAGLGDGRRARRDVAAVGARVPRASTRAGSSRSPGISSGASTPSRAGTSAARRSSAPERMTLYGLPIGSRTVGHPDRDAVHPPGARRGRVAAPATRSSPRTRAGSRRSRRSRSAPASAACSSRTTCWPTSSPPASPRTSSPAARFDRWYPRAGPDDLLVYPRELLRTRTPTDPDAGRRTTWKQGDHELRLSYRFEPGAPDDGVTVHVPLERARRTLRDVGFDWLVPALREELVTALIRGPAQGAAPPVRARAGHRRAA